MNSNIQRLRAIAQELRTVPSIGRYPGICERMGGLLVGEALDLGAFAGPEHVALRMKIAENRARCPATWQSGAYILAVMHFAADIVKERRLLAAEELAFEIIAQAIEQESRLQPQSHDAKPFGLDPEAETVLRALAQAPNRLFTVVDLAEAARVSNKTAGERVNAFIDQGYAVRPRGKKGGVQVTAKGLEFAQENRMT